MNGLGKGGHQNPGKLVVEKYNNWKKAKDLFKDHQNNHYHKLSQIKYDNFLAIRIKKVEPIDRQINEALKKEINDNRVRLLPRQCKSNNPEYFLRVSVFIPFIDNFLDQLNDRFISHRIVLNNFDCILPKIEMKISEEIKGKFKQLVETYQDIVDECTDSNLNDNLLNGELDLWYTKYSTLTSAELKNKNAIELYFQTCPDVYPRISKLLQIFITLPVSTATEERSFSTLRCLKTYLRNSSGQIRLNGLALLNIHRDVNVDINDRCFFSWIGVRSMGSDSGDSSLPLGSRISLSMVARRDATTDNGRLQYRANYLL
ncbi:hypothetical protein QTP88_022899 [Uroleucon formosanum]